MSKQRQIGTKAESAVVSYLREHGFGGAERRALHGNTDLGDILVCPGVIAEVKAGHAAWNASDNQMSAWWDETCVEKNNAHAERAFLVVARYRKPAQDWWVFWRSHFGVMHWKRLQDEVWNLRMLGYGDPLDT